MENNYYKYLKYKNKYLKEKNLKKNLVGGAKANVNSPPNPSKPNVNLQINPSKPNYNNMIPTYSMTKQNDTNSLRESIERMRAQTPGTASAAPRVATAAAAAAAAASAAPRGGVRPFAMPLPDGVVSRAAPAAASASAAPRVAPAAASDFAAPRGDRPFAMPLPDGVVSRAAPAGIVLPTGNPNSLIDFIHYIINLNNFHDLHSTYTYWINITYKFFQNNIDEILGEYALIKQQLELLRIYREKYRLPSVDDLRLLIEAIKEYERQLPEKAFCIQLWDAIHRT
jgi:hypothetical protein